MNEEKETSKNILGKLKRLMTVTEKDVLEEEEKEKRRLKEAVPVVDKKQKKKAKTASQEDDEAEQSKEKNRKPILKIVDSDPHFTEDDNTSTEEESAVQNEDDVELMGNHERSVQNKARKNSGNNTEIKKEQLNKSKYSTEEDDEEESDYTSDDDDNELYQFENIENQEKTNDRKPRKKKKNFFNSLFKIGQALNAKPDEFVSDDIPVNVKGKDNSDKDIQKAVNDSSILGSSENSANDNQANVQQSQQSVAKKEEPVGPPILDIDMSFATVQKVNGNIFIEGNIEPMYTIENNSATFNVEIGKLSPILLNAYEAYLQPEILEAKKAEQAKKQAEAMDEEIITQATTAFGNSDTDEIKRDNPFDEDVNANESNIHRTRSNSVGVMDTLTNKINENQSIRNKKKAEEIKRAQEQKKQQAQKKKQRKTVKEKLFSEYSVAVDYNAIASNEDKVQHIEDYESQQDAGAVMAEINLNIRKLFFRTLIVGIVFVLQLALVVIQKFFPTLLTGIVPNVQMMFCVATLVLLSVAVGVGGMSVKNGLIPLIGFKGNSDTAVAIASVATIMQSVVSLFDCNAFYNGSRSLYAILAIFALGLNLLGKMTMVLRIKDNFRFVAQDRRKYAATILNDKKNAEKMVRGTNAADPIVAYQRKTYFYKNFLKLSYAPDPSETTAGKFSIISLVISATVAIIHGIMFKNIIGAFSAFAMVACLSVPASCLLAVNIPMKKLCRKALNNDAMIAGYTAVTQFVDTSAIMVDSKELYPSSSVELVSLKPYITSNLENYMLNAAAVLKVANTSLTYVFADVIEKKGDSLPYVDSVKFEENKGIVGWIGGERVLIGRRALMEKYGVELPPIDDETAFIEERRNITYLASAGQLVAMIVTAYNADEKTKAEIKKLENEGVSVLVRTADPNLTVESIASDYGLHIRSVKILPNSLGNICKEAISEKSRRARCYIGTRGKLSSLANAITGCIRIKSCITVAVIIQVIGIVLGMLFTSAVALTSGEQGINAFELLGFMAFWVIATIGSTYIRKP